MWCWFMENFWWLWMILAMWEFSCCAWTCRKLFVNYPGHVGIFCAWLWKNLVVVYGYVKNFDCGEIFGGVLIDFFFFGRALIFGCEQFLVTWVLVGGILFFGHVCCALGNFFWTCNFFVVGNFWACDFFVDHENDELNFCVA